MQERLGSEHLAHRDSAKDSEGKVVEAGTSVSAPGAPPLSGQGLGPEVAMCMSTVSPSHPGRGLLTVTTVSQREQTPSQGWTGGPSLLFSLQFLLKQLHLHRSSSLLSIKDFCFTLLLLQVSLLCP